VAHLVGQSEVPSEQEETLTYEMRSGVVQANSLDAARRQGRWGFGGSLEIVFPQSCSLFRLLDGIGGLSELFTSPLVKFGLPVSPEGYIGLDKLSVAEQKSNIHHIRTSKYLAHSTQ
jgi:hypothetical protein